MENSKPRRSNEVGPVGQRTAHNLEELREGSKLSQDDLAAAVERLGRPMTRQIVGKTEAATRRIDVDDLVAFAVALRATPNRLLLAPTADAGRTVEITPDYQVSELEAWLWALGERPLDRGFDAPQLQMVLDSDRARWFVQRNRPVSRPDGPALGDLVRAHPELATAIRKVVREARRLGVGVEAVQESLYNAYLWAPEDGDVPQQEQPVVAAEPHDDHGT